MPDLPVPRIHIGSRYIFRPLPFETMPAPSNFVLATIRLDDTDSISQYQRVRPRLLEVLERIFPTSASPWGLTLLTREPSWPDPSQVYDMDSQTPSIYISCANPEPLLEGLDGILPLCPESSPGNPAAWAYIGTSTAAERGMVTWIMRLYEGYGDLYIPRISGG